jgi:hypothetical protein
LGASAFTGSAATSASGVSTDASASAGLGFHFGERFFHLLLGSGFGVIVAFGLVEDAIKLVERNFANAHFALFFRLWLRFGCRLWLGLRFGNSFTALGGDRQAFQFADQVLIVTNRLRTGSFQIGQNGFQAINGKQDQANPSVVTGQPSRYLPIKVSAACARLSSRGKPRKPQVPLIV